MLGSWMFAVASELGPTTTVAKTAHFGERLEIRGKPLDILGLIESSRLS